MRICPISSNAHWQPFYVSNTGKIMTGDQRVGDGNLKKVICPECGIVANENAFTAKELEVLYGKEYELNTLEKEEHFFYTPSGPVARSQVFADWIEPYLTDDQFQSFIEIGCGEGNLLKRLVEKFPKTKIMGFDGSHKASELAKKKGLDVQQKLIVGNELLPKSDVFILINVIEHIEDITLLLSSLKNALNSNGRIIFCLPIQDYGGYDIFFAEHVWHFTSNHFLAILEKNGLKVIHSDINHPVNHGIGLFVCKKNQSEKYKNTEYSDIIEKNLAFWETNFKGLDDFLMSQPSKKIAIFGAGEVFTLFLTFTSLGKQHIIACIDDTKKDGDLKHGIPIHNSEWLSENQIDLLLLAVNKKYHKMIEEKFAGLNLNMHPIY